MRSDKELLRIMERLNQAHQHYTHFQELVSDVQLEDEVVNFCLIKLDEWYLKMIKHLLKLFKAEQMEEDWKRMIKQFKEDNGKNNGTSKKDS